MSLCLAQYYCVLQEKRQEIQICSGKAAAKMTYEGKVVIVSGGQIRFAFICANNTNVNEGWFLAVQNSSIGDLVTH